MPIEQRNGNQEYRSASDGFLLVVANANNATQENRAVQANCEFLLNGVWGRVASTIAQDSYLEGVFSIFSNSMTVPIPRGTPWRVTVNETDRPLVSITWISFSG